MIAGATYTLPLDIRYPVRNTDKIIITLKNESTGIKRTKRYPNDEETRLLADGRIGARLTQQDTVDLVGYVKVEAQINLKSGSVAKTTTERTFISPTLNTEMVAGAVDNGENLLNGVTLELGAPITEAEGGEGTSFQPGNALELKDGILNVLTTDDAEQGNNLPITSQGARKLADNISYNDLKDRPFYEETEIVNEPLNITWDGNTEGLLCVEIPNGTAFYKVSNIILTDEQIKMITETDNTGSTAKVGEFWDQYVVEGNVSEDFVASWAIYVRKDGAELFGTVFPETGIYFPMWFNGDHQTSITTTDPIEYTNTVVHKLDKKFLPKAETSDIVFTGVQNDEGWYDYICNVDYAKARKALIDGATARMILVSGKEIKHLTLQSVQYNDWRVKLNFFDIKDTNAEYGIIDYNKDGSIGGGVE